MGEKTAYFSSLGKANQNAKVRTWTETSIVCRRSR